MIEVNITKDQIERAKALYEFDHLKNSIAAGKSNIFGALGEIIAHDYLTYHGKSSAIAGNYDYDLIVESTKIDVKTKRTTVTPKGHYNCSVADYNTSQNCDYYLFCRIKEDLSKGYILGFVEKSLFYEQAEFKTKGEYDGAFEFKADCYNLPIKNLKKDFSIF